MFLKTAETRYGRTEAVYEMCRYHCYYLDIFYFRLNKNLSCIFCFDSRKYRNFSSILIKCIY